MLVVLKEYDVSDQIKITPPKFWLEKQDAKVLELCEDAETGNLVIRKKESHDPASPHAHRRIDAAAEETQRG